MMISICIITKNESNKIKKCLETVSKLGYEIVVVDTGSTDDTRDIALQYTDKVYDFEWVDDFSAARNFCASKASNDFIFVIDSDEYLIEFDKKYIENKLLKNPRCLGSIKRNEKAPFYGENIAELQISYADRIYNKNKYHYVGYVHEQIKPINPLLKNVEASDCVDLPVTVEHDGYMQTPEQKKHKAKRYVDLLEKQLRDENINKYIQKEYTMYQIGKSYVYGGDFVRGYAYLKATLDYDLEPRTPWVLDLIITYMQVLVELRQYDEALQLYGVYDAFDYSADFVFYMGYIHYLIGDYENAISEYKKATKFENSIVKGRNSYLALYNIGVIYEGLGDMENAKAYYKKALPYTMAKESLEQIK